MPRVLVPLASGCEELEAVTIIDLLRRAEIEVVTAGLEPGPVTCSRGTVLVPDVDLDDVVEDDFEMVILPGGQPGATHLDRDTRIHDLLARQAAADRWTAAICAAPSVLASTGLLDGRSATSFPGAVDPKRYPEIRLLEQPVVIDGKIVTSRGPGTAMDFALQLIELLLDADRRAAVEAKLMRPR
ncbi:DJ-1 family glyoxalase III [Lamprobacter modestohalophilus]|uniref:DJ-1 family glyoxalase III n=1 Tax=Lamprobacter modestohalophilus TaxID=1064514 RepID=UPI002ADEAC0F|nr:DJ-1 family glyoxalase III [Lamprobacter modestohalophilus]MCF7995551.1 DJ-1/PfpI family protein [Chromatiaceae bacterium]MEA1051493.1 DJ-1 family glyoxalase III [Lamprobacter modestohalophilus]